MPCRRPAVVVKVGSSSLTTAAGGLDGGPGRGRWSTCWPSGAAPARRSSWCPPARSPPGSRRWDCPAGRVTWRPCRRRPSVGQGLLVASVRRGVRPARDRGSGQVLLTVDDVVRRAHYRNARATLRAAARPAGRAGRQRERRGRHRRDPLRRQRPAGRARGAPRRRRPAVLLSDVDGLFDGDPRRGPARLIDEVRSAAPTSTASESAGAGAAGVGSGGMATKVEAARVATAAGVPTVVCSRRRTPAPRWPASGRARCSTRPAGARAPGCCGCAHATQPRGRLILDEGAVAGCRAAAHVVAAGRHHRCRRAVRRR